MQKKKSNHDHYPVHSVGTTCLQVFDVLVKNNNSNKKNGCTGTFIVLVSSSQEDPLISLMRLSVLVPACVCVCEDVGGRLWKGMEESFEEVSSSERFLCLVYASIILCFRNVGLLFSSFLHSNIRWKERGEKGKTMGRSNCFLSLGGLRMLK